jgi:hypothetical protein
VARQATAWSVKGVDQATRDIARRASQAAGVTIGEWIDQAIQADAQIRGDIEPAGSKPGTSPPPTTSRAPASGRVSLSTVDQLASRLDAADARLDAAMRPIAYALQGIAQRLVAVEQRAELDGPRRRPASQQALTDARSLPALPDAAASSQADTPLPDPVWDEQPDPDDAWTQPAATMAPASYRSAPDRLAATPDAADDIVPAVPRRAACLTHRQWDGKRRFGSTTPNSPTPLTRCGPSERRPTSPTIRTRSWSPRRCWKQTHSAWKICRRTFRIARMSLRPPWRNASPKLRP